MANNPFDRTVINPRERPLSQDINQAQSEHDYTLRAFLQQLFSVRNAALIDSSVPTTGFVGDSYKVRVSSPAALSVQVSAGYGFRYDPSDLPTDIGGALALDDRSAYKPLVLLAPQTIAVPAADPVNARIDIVEVAQDRRAQDPASRDILDPTTGVFTPNLVNKILAFNQDGRTSVNGAAKINYKTGTPAGSPVAPAVTAGYTKIAEVDVPALATAVNLGQIRDLRTILAPNGVRRGAFVYSLATPSTQTLLQAFAPPGCLVVRGAQNGGAGQIGLDLFVLAGNLPTSGKAAAQVCAHTGAIMATSQAVAQLIDASYTTLSSGQATAIRSNNAGVDAAPGQPAILVQVAPYTFSAAPLYSQTGATTYYVTGEILF